jgi:hypothetical protein
MKHFLTVLFVVSLLVGGGLWFLKPVLHPAPIPSEHTQKVVFNLDKIFTKEVPLNGSCLFWNGGLLVKPISKHTGSTITHATIILYEDSKPYVYEAVPPVVHRVPLKEYITSMANHKRKDFSYFIVEPKHRYTKDELIKMKAYADSQLGRQYMMRGYWKGHEVRGIMCSQFAGNTIEKSGLIKSDNFHETPGSLYRKLLPYYSEVK